MFMLGMIIIITTIMKCIMTTEEKQGCIMALIIKLGYIKNSKNFNQTKFGNSSNFNDYKCIAISNKNRNGKMSHLANSNNIKFNYYGKSNTNFYTDNIVNSNMNNKQEIYNTKMKSNIGICNDGCSNKSALQ